MHHQWHIESNQYERHESRRGRRHAFSNLDPQRTAFVVVDMVPFFCEQNPYCRGIVAAIATLADRLRAAGGTVAWIVPALADCPTQMQREFYGPQVAARYAASGGSESIRERVWFELTVDDGDLVLDKSAASAFFPGRCELHNQLQARPIDTVVVAGTVANVCCESTIRDAHTLDYRVIAVADAMAAVSDQDLNATLHTVYRSFGDVRPVTEVLDLISTSVS